MHSVVSIAIFLRKVIATQQWTLVLHNVGCQPPWFFIWRIIKIGSPTNFPLLFIQQFNQHYHPGRFNKSNHYFDIGTVILWITFLIGSCNISRAHVHIGKHMILNFLPNCLWNATKAIRKLQANNAQFSSWY